jgi:hypothetical protein
MLLCSGCTAGKFTGIDATSSSGAAMDGNSGVGVAAAATDHLPAASACQSGAPAPRGLRRLTLVELNNTLQDLFGDANAPQSTALFAGDATAYGFNNIQTALAVRDNQAMVLSAFAETVGTYAAGKSAQLSTCQTLDAACRQSFIKAFGRKAFRAPLTDSQVADYDALMATKGCHERDLHQRCTGCRSSRGLLRQHRGQPGQCGKEIRSPCLSR